MADIVGEHDSCGGFKDFRYERGIETNGGENTQTMSCERK